MLEYQAGAEALYEALKDDPFYKALEAQVPKGRNARSAMLAYYDLSIRDGAVWGRISMPADGSYGVSVWSLPLSDTGAQQRRADKQAALLVALGPAALQLFNDIEASMAGHEAPLKLDGFWYLSILGVHPSMQGKGRGAALLQPVLQEADTAGVSSYLTTFSPGNIRFYEGLGFENKGTFEEPVSQSAFSVLVRTAR